MPTKGHPLQRRLAKQMRHLKKWLFKLRPSKLVTVLLLLLIWLYRERQESDEQLDELLEANPESKLAYYVRLVRNKLINFLLFIVVPCLVIVYNLSDGDLMRKIGRFGQESSLVQLFCSIFGFFTGRADEVDELDEQDKARLYQKYDVTIEKLPLELENLRLELKKELKQMKRAVETLAKDHQQFRTVANRFRSGNDTKLETFENKLLEIINEELGRVKDSLLDRINHFQKKYSFLDPSNYEKFCEMFETADAAADLIRKRDHQLKDLFKATTEIILKSELTDEELKEVKRAYLDLVEEIKSNNQDLTKYVEHVKQISDDHLTNKFKSDQIKLFNEMENLRTEVDLKEKDFSRLSSVVGAVEQSINSVRKKFTEYDDKIRHCVKEIDEFRDIIENLTIFVNTDVTGKINGILRFLGKGEMEQKS